MALILPGPFLVRYHLTDRWLVICGPFFDYKDMTNCYDGLLIFYPNICVAAFVWCGLTTDWVMIYANNELAEETL